jgi:5-methyltetrahydrofolate corrinoid/iron sulfur protein methyltransferase
MALKIIGENLNVISRVIGAAFRDRNQEPIQQMALGQKEAGDDYIDINLGPARKKGDELMAWVVQTVQAVVPDMPLCLDTSNIEALEAGLSVHKGKAIINSIMCRPERYEVMIPLAVKYKANMIALMWGPEGLPRDENERAALCVELVYAANSAGVPNEDIWVDGIVTPVNIQQPQLISLLAFQQMLQEIAPGSKSTCGLSNISNGPPDHLRPILNQTYMIMLKRHGMYSVIADSFDKKLHEIAWDKRPDLEGLVNRVMDGERIDEKDLDKEKLEFYKTARVIGGHTLYSDSWLEL